MLRNSTIIKKGRKWSFRYSLSMKFENIWNNTRTNLWWRPLLIEVLLKVLRELKKN